MANVKELFFGQENAEYTEVPLAERAEQLQSQILAGRAQQFIDNQAIQEAAKAEQFKKPEDPAVSSFQKPQTPKIIEKKQRPKLDYISGSQARIFIGGILVDEVFDLQYQYKETKEPLYGYNSKYFDHILRGQVIIYGSFTINYIHDAYLYSILKKTNSKNSIQDEKNLINDRDNYKKDFTKLLRDHKGTTQRLYDLKRQLKQEDGLSLLAATDRDNSKQGRFIQLKDLEQKLENAKTEKAKYESQFTKNYLGELANKRSEFRDMHSGEPGSIAELTDTLRSNMYDLNQLINELEGCINSNQSELDKTNKDIDNLNKLKETMNASSPDWLNINVEIGKLTNKTYEISSSNDALFEKLSPLQDRKDDLQAKLTQALQSKDTEISSFVSSNPEVAELERLDLLIKNIEAEIEAIKNIHSVENDSDTYKDRQENNKAFNIRQSIGEAEFELNSLQDQLASIKTKQRKLGIDIIDELSELKSQEQRAEDFDKFNIFVEFNGAVHKILKDCSLLGHASQLSTDGTCIKEQYTFISRIIEDH